MIGQEQRFHPEYSSPEKLYIALFGVPIIGLRIRARNVLNLLPKHLSPARILDAGSGPGVISFLLSQRYPAASVLGIDHDTKEIENCRAISQRAQIENAAFEVADLQSLTCSDRFDLIVCVDILEHIENDIQALHTLFRALAPGGTLLLHVPALYRRYPVFKKRVNFDVPGHVRPGYAQEEIVTKVQAAGFTVEAHGYTYGFLETVVNNISYMITGAQKKNRALYGLAFPALNLIGWLGRHATPLHLGAGVFVRGAKPLPPPLPLA